VDGNSNTARTVTIPLIFFFEKKKVKLKINEPYQKINKRTMMALRSLTCIKALKQCQFKPRAFI
jgi:hypothetical protein